MADVIADMTAYSNQAILDMAEWAGVSVWGVIASMATAIIVILLIAVYLIERRHEAPVDAPADEGQLEFVEKTLAEFPAEMVDTQGGEGKIVIKLISPKPIVEEKPLLPQEVKGEPLPSKVEEPKKEEPEPKSEPIAMGAVGAPPKKPEETK